MVRKLSATGSALALVLLCALFIFLSSTGAEGQAPSKRSITTKVPSALKKPSAALVMQGRSTYWEFDYGDNFSGGLARVCVHDVSTPQGQQPIYVWGYMGKSGKFLVQPDFAYAYDFSEGLALVAFDPVGNDDPADYEWGFITPTGKWAIPPTFLNARYPGARIDPTDADGYVVDEDDPGYNTYVPRFSQGLARVWLYAPLQQTIYQCYIDKKGRVVIGDLK